MSAPRTNVVSFPYTDRRPDKVFADSRHPEIAQASDHWQALYKARTCLQRQERRGLRRLHAAIDRNLSFKALSATRAMVARDRAARLRRSDDAGLLVAEEELVRLLDESRDDPNGDSPEDTARWDRIGELIELIQSTPPQSLAGCAVKLRFLTDEEVGLEFGDREDDVQSLRQVLAFIEAAIMPGDAAWRFSAQLEPKFAPSHPSA